MKPYLQNYYLLNKLYNFTSDIIEVSDYDFSIHNFQFVSDISEKFPQASECISIANKNKEKLRIISQEKNTGCDNSEKIFNILDSEIKENNNFVYPLYKKNNNNKSDSVIILLHGLNEKRWDKYHPWANALTQFTGKDVLLFPISCHINRVPRKWKHPRMMDNLSKERMRFFPDILDTSFVNAALSTRLQFKPETFFWSGLRTHNDIIKLLEIIKSDSHPLIDKNAKIDFFSYSIGAFLTEILFLSNYNDWFSESKAFLFCGGPTMNGMYSASKYIYDSEADKEMTKFYVNDFENSIFSSEGLKNYFENPDGCAIAFRAMLNYDIMREFREEKLKTMKDRISAFALKKDIIIPQKNVKETLHSRDNSIGINVEIMDFPYEYDHFSPFPLNENIQDDVDKCFRNVFKKASEFYLS